MTASGRWHGVPVLSSCLNIAGLPKQVSINAASWGQSYVKSEGFMAHQSEAHCSNCEKTLRLCRTKCKNFRYQSGDTPPATIRRANKPLALAAKPRQRQRKFMSRHVMVTFQEEMPKPADVAQGRAAPKCSQFRDSAEIIPEKEKPRVTGSEQSHEKLQNRADK